jgi:hypothetical protein
MHRQTDHGCDGYYKFEQLMQRPLKSWPLSFSHDSEGILRHFTHSHFQQMNPTRLYEGSCYGGI